MTPDKERENRGQAPCDPLGSFHLTPPLQLGPMNEAGARSEGDKRMSERWALRLPKVRPPNGRCGNSPRRVDLSPKSQDRLSLGALGTARMGPETVCRSALHKGPLCVLALSTGHSLAQVHIDFKGLVSSPTIQDLPCF